MDYQAHYDRLIERARHRQLDGYVERHHVIPRCIRETTDTVDLTPEEHYVAHQLLVKIHTGNASLIYAALRMTGAPGHVPRRNKVYGWLRRRLSAEMTGQKRQPHTDVTRRKMSLAAAGKSKSVTHRASLAAAKRGRSGNHTSAHSEEAKERIRQVKTTRTDAELLTMPASSLSRSQRLRIRELRAT